jgi:hypothetical protein
MSGSKRCIRGGTLVTALLAAFVTTPVRADEHATAKNVATWTYHTELPGVRPVARTIQLDAQRPEDLADEPNYEGTAQRYAQLRYGSDNSRRVILVVDQLDSGPFHLYADLNRDRAIDASEQIVGTSSNTERSRRFSLDAEIIQEDTVRSFPREVEIRLGFAGDRLAVATLGGIVGTIELPDPTSDSNTGNGANRDVDNNKPILVQRIDADANGLFADSRDRLRIDLNQDERIDPVTEQFAWLPVQKVQGRRYAVKADREGMTLSLQEITGTGTIQIAIASLPEHAKLLELEAMVFSDDGSAWSLKEANKPQEVPVGRYTLGSITLTIDTGESEPWHYVFSRSDNIEEDDWQPVGSDSAVSLEAIGNLTFSAGNIPAEASAGQQLTINPRLYTEAGLLINLSCRGKQIGSFDNSRTHNACDIQLVGDNQQPVNSAQSGFA